MKTLLKILTTFSILFPLTAAAAPRFVDASELLGRAELRSAARALAAQFDDVCGDTFCEGVFNDVQPLDLTCSVAADGSRVGGCTWTFAGTATDIDPATGAVSVNHAVTTCELPVDGDAAALKAFLGKASLFAVLPGQAEKTLMDAITDCL